MSLAGVILALGDMVDSACVLIENAHEKIAVAEREGAAIDRREIVISAAKEGGSSARSRSRRRSRWRSRQSSP